MAQINMNMQCLCGNTYDLTHYFKCYKCRTYAVVLDEQRGMIAFAIEQERTLRQMKGWLVFLGLVVAIPLVLAAGLVFLGVLGSALPGR